MRQTRYNPINRFPAVNIDELLDQFAGKTIADLLGADFISASPSVNIINDADVYRIEIAAPGLTKDLFSIEVENNQLTISAKREEENPPSDKEVFKRREFDYSNFKRNFYLSEEVDTNDINATYVNGILAVVLAKREEEKDVKKTIEIG